MTEILNWVKLNNLVDGMRKGRHVLLLLFFLIICYFLSTVSQLYLHNWEKVRILWRLKNYVKTSTAWEHWGIRLDKNISMSQIHLKLKHTDFKLLNILLGVLFHQEPVKWDLFFLHTFLMTQYENIALPCFWNLHVFNMNTMSFYP